MVLLKMVGALHDPNDKINHSNNPKVMADASFFMFLERLGMYQYPLAKSRVRKNFALASFSVSILGRGSTSIFVIAFNF